MTELFTNKVEKLLTDDYYFNQIVECHLKYLIILKLFIFMIFLWESFSSSRIFVSIKFRKARSTGSFI